MARRKNKTERIEESMQAFFDLHPHAKRGAVAVLLLALAAVLTLSSFGSAGPAGNFLFAALSKLVGFGYYLIPFILFLIALVLLFTERASVLGITLIGSILLVLSGLGIIDIVSPEKGGLLGSLVGLIQIPFGYTAALIITVAFFLASLITTLNVPIKLKNPFAGGADEEDESEILTPEEEENIEEADEEERAAQKEEEDKGVDVKEAEQPRFLSLRRSTVLPRAQHKNYTPPPLSLLKSLSEKPTSGDLRANANIIKRTLESFGIPVEMGEINIGPKVTRYTLKPAEGVKLSRITVLNSDLALALAAHPIRIEAPIPGKSLVGIEVPNKAAAIVRLGSLMNYEEFAKAGELAFVLGRDVTGTPIFGDITKMPHLLVAGATGSGKSVMLQTLIMSLLYKNSPQTLRFAMIDPKRVELSIYNGIPHLISPVVTEGKKTLAVFRWALSEMERRYALLEEAGNRDVKSYNADKADDPLPYVVIIIDELADLMAAYGREIEGSIVRIAQMARATGIHLVVATQRPSVEVITGLIKANITSRVALQVASQIDSRTILDAAGAEKLLGGGDMLFISPDYSKPKRIQGAYITEDEIRSVAEFIKKENPLQEDEDALEIETGRPTNLFEAFQEQNGDDEDEMLDEAIMVVREAQKASASLLQRRLKVGYARAARLLDIMEEKGIVGPGDGAKPREVFVEPPIE